MTPSPEDTPFTPEQQARIQERIRAEGIAFEAFLPKGMADWLRDKLAAGVFDSPRDAAFVAFQQLIELDRHPEVKRQLLTASIQSSIDDPRPSVPAEEVFAQLRRRLSEPDSPEED